MQTRLLHAVLSGIIIAMVLGFSLIPETWQIMNQQNEEPIFGPTNNAIIGIIVSVAVMIVTLFSFKLVRRVEE